MASSSLVFAKLEPRNAAAKVAFHEAYEDGRDTESAQHTSRMSVGAQQEFDRDAHRYCADRLLNSFLNYDDTTSVGTGADSESELEAGPGSKHFGEIWLGAYLFDILVIPNTKDRGWLYGTGRSDRAIDFKSSGPDEAYGIRGWHASFNLCTTTGYLVLTVRGEASINGLEIRRGQRAALNQAAMIVRFGQLEYSFSYTQLATTTEYYEQRQRHMQSLHGCVADFSLTPTPSGQARTIGPWTLGISLGKGAFGKVYTATDRNSSLVAIKIVEKTSRLTEQLQTLQDLQRLLQRSTGNKNLLAFREVISQNGGNPAGNFEDIAIVLEPVVHATLCKWTLKARPRRKLDADAKALDPNMQQLLKDVLNGVAFLHSNGFLHGDLKPNNIGVNGTTAILLDLEDCVRLPPKSKVSTAPGTCGTIGYIAPERELQAHDHTIDVWSIGIILFELLAGFHPINLRINPWRPGKRYEELRPSFHNEYASSIQHCEDIARHCLFAKLAMDMMRHAWASGSQCLPRISAAEALAHECWKVDDHKHKRRKDGRPVSPIA